MSLLNKLKLVAGLKTEEKQSQLENNHYDIQKEDKNDVIFAKNLIKNNGNFFYCDKQDELIKTIQGLNAKLNLNSIYCIEPILQDLLNKSAIIYNKYEHSKCDAILSSCEYLIAQQGKVMLSSKQIGPNNIKNLPQTHIIIAYTSQIVKSLNEGMSGLNRRYIDNLPSTITTIKSQTNNEQKSIEGNIKELSVVLIEDYRDSKSI